MGHGEDLVRANALVNQGRGREAAPILLEVLADQPDSARALCLLASCHYLAEDWPAMLTTADRAVTVAPRDEWAHRLQAIALRWAGRHDAAVEASRRAVALGPQVWANHVTLAEHLLVRRGPGDLADAYRAALRAVEVAPERGTGHATLGLVLQAAGNRRGARRAYAQALERDPDERGALTNLALLDARAGRVVRAAGRLRRAWGRLPERTMYRRGLGVVRTVAVAQAAIGGALLCLAVAAVASTRPPAGLRIGAGLLAAAAYLGLAVALVVALRRAAPDLARRARPGRPGAVLVPLCAAVIPLDLALIAVLAFSPGFLDSSASWLLAVPVAVAASIPGIAIGAAVRTMTNMSRWVRLRRGLASTPPSPEHSGSEPTRA
jgi:tetratricopeptide (TPR) repeat protein